MAFRGKKQELESSGSKKDQGVTIITAGCHFSGKLFCRGVSRIGGKIEGEIVAEGVLIIEEGAHIDADIRASEVIVQGVVNGKLEADTRVELITSGRFSGELVTPSLHVEQGAYLNGTTTMKEPEGKGANKVEKFLDLKKKKVKQANGPDIDPSVSLAKGSKDTKTPEVSI